jgi:hypothetical protein
MGYPTPDLLMGLALAICRTYLSDVASGKEITLPIVAQGGTFLNDAVVAAFREVLGLDESGFIRHADPRYVIGAGALGAALLARVRFEEGYDSAFKGFDAVSAGCYQTVSLDCRHPDCARRCSGVVALLEDGRPIAGYRSIDCPLGFFEGLIASDRTAAHMRTLIEEHALQWEGGAPDEAESRHPSGPHIPLPVLAHR